jgi:hypothetical protein
MLRHYEGVVAQTLDVRQAPWMTLDYQVFRLLAGGRGWAEAAPSEASGPEEDGEPEKNR